MKDCCEAESSELMALRDMNKENAAVPKQYTSAEARQCGIGLLNRNINATLADQAKACLPKAGP